MKQILLIFTLLFITISSYAQDNFKEGYYLKTNGDRVTGLIKVQDNNTNPTEIAYKRSTMGPQQTIKSSNMLGFGIGNSIQYDKYTIKVSKASDDIDYMDRVKEFDLVQETALLKLLVDGEAQLYEYSEGGITQYFVKKGNDITSLLYKRYLLRGGIATNNQYKQQLSTLLTCDSGKLPDPVNLKYTARSLTKFLRSYNECNGSLNNSFVNKERVNTLHIKAFGGLQSSSLEVDGTQNRSFDFGNQTSFVPGIELELRFKSQKNDNMWSIFFDARRHTFEASAMTPFMVFPSEIIFFRETKAVYEAIDIGFGARYYINIGVNSNIFFGVNGSIDVIGTREITYDDVGVEDLISNHPTGILGIGVGYNWKNLSAEARIHTNRDISDAEQGSATTTSYSNLALTLSYSFLNLKI